MSIQKRLFISEKRILFFCVVFPLSFLFFFAVRFSGFSQVIYFYIIALPSFVLFFDGARFWFYKIAVSRQFFVVSSIVLLYIFICLVYILLHGTGDFSIVKPMLHVLLSLPACMAAAAFLLDLGFDESKRHHLLLFLGWLLKLQSLTIIVMLLHPGFRDLVFEVFRTSEEVELMKAYDGARGLGISGSMAFGLAVFLSYLYFFYFSMRYLFNGEKLYFMDVLWMVFCGVALLSAGRSSVLGIAFVPLFVFLASLNHIFSVFKQICFLVLACLVFGFGVYSALGFFESDAISLYLFYVSEPILAYVGTGTVEVSSLATLNEMYQYPSDITMLIGDGRYVNPDGSAYRHVDAGYMRHIFFGGIFFCFLVYSAFVFFVFSIFNSLLRWNWSKFQAFSFLFLICLMGFIFQYKGQVIFASVYFYRIFLTLSFVFSVGSVVALKSRNVGVNQPASTARPKEHLY